MYTVATVKFFEDSSSYNHHNGVKLQPKPYSYLVPDGMEVKKDDILIVRVYDNKNGPMRFVKVVSVDQEVTRGSATKYVVARLDIEGYLNIEKREEEQCKAREFLRLKAAELAHQQQYTQVMNHLTEAEQQYIFNTLGMRGPATVDTPAPTSAKTGYAPGYYTVTDGAQTTTLYTTSAAQAIETISGMWNAAKETLTATRS